MGSYAGAGGRCAQVARKAAKCRGKRGNTDKKTGAFVGNRLRFTRKKRECLFMSFFFWGFARVYIPRGFWASHDVLGPESWRFQKRD